MAAKTNGPGMGVRVGVGVKVWEGSGVGVRVGVHDGSEVGETVNVADGSKVRLGGFVRATV